MDIQKVEQLIEKYYKGETSVNEENQLVEYFNTTSDIPEHLLNEKEVFSMYAMAADEEVPIEGFMDNLEKVIDDRVKVRRIGVRNKVYWITSVAASIAILVSSYFMFINTRSSSMYEITDPQLAYEETQKALLYVSQKLNKGTAPLSNLTLINKPAESLQNLEKLDEGLDQLQKLELLNR